MECIGIVCACVKCLGIVGCTCVKCLGIVGVYMCGVHRDCGCVHVWSV